MVTRIASSGWSGKPRGLAQPETLPWRSRACNVRSSSGAAARWPMWRMPCSQSRRPGAWKSCASEPWRSCSPPSSTWGDHETVATDARALTLSQPIRRPRQLLMLALHRGDRQRSRSRRIRSSARLLRDELGLKPTSAPRDLHRAILRRDVEPAVAAVREVRFDVPAPVTSLIGRHIEIAELGDLLQLPDVAPRHRDWRRRHRQEPARGCRRGGDARTVRERGRVRRARAARRSRTGRRGDRRQLGVAERGGEDLLQTLSRWLAPRELLLILDNLERLVEPARRSWSCCGGRRC